MATSYRLRRKMFAFGFNRFRDASKFSGMANAAGNSIQRLQEKANGFKNSGNTAQYDATMKQIQQRKNQQQNYNQQAMTMAGKGFRNLALGSIGTVATVAAGKAIFDKLTGED